MKPLKGVGKAALSLLEDTQLEGPDFLSKAPPEI
jgi:hypothetical protein